MSRSRTPAASFREWVALPRPDRRRWRALLGKAKTFAADQDTGGESTAPPAGHAEPGFAGFGEDGLAFLADLEHDNSKAYFDAHRDLYRRALLAPAKAFVVALGDLLTARVSKALRAEPRIGGSMFRIANDLRFSTGRPPYKTHLDFAFWEGEHGPRRDPALILRLTPTEVAPRRRGTHPDRTRTAPLPDRPGRPGPARRPRHRRPAAARRRRRAERTNPVRVPPGIDPTGPAAPFALRDGFHLTRRFPRSKHATTPAFSEWCAERFEPFTPVHRWLAATLSGG